MIGTDSKHERLLTQECREFFSPCDTFGSSEQNRKRKRDVRRYFSLQRWGIAFFEVEYYCTSTLWLHPEAHKRLRILSVSFRELWKQSGHRSCEPLRVLSAEGQPQKLYTALEPAEYISVGEQEETQKCIWSQKQLQSENCCQQNIQPKHQGMIETELFALHNMKISALLFVTQSNYNRSCFNSVSCPFVSHMRPHPHAPACTRTRKFVCVRVCVSAFTCV